MTPNAQPETKEAPSALGLPRTLRAGCLLLFGSLAFVAVERSSYYYDSPAVLRLIEAIWQGDAEAVEKSLVEGADPNSITRDVRFYFFLPSTREDSPMHVASRAATPEIMRSLLVAGGDLNLKVRGRANPLQRVLWSARPATTQVVLEYLETLPNGVDLVASVWE